jgi:hypothetical protein
MSGSEDSPAVAVAHLECPDCGAVVPITAETEVEDGNLVVNLNDDDVWAHSFTHEESSATE